MPSVPIQTYEQVGIKEDISDIISNIAPTKTPFMTMIGSENIENTLFQWQEDTLASVVSAPALEGATAPTAVWQPTVMRNNVTQILNEAVVVSDTAETVTVYGRAKEMAYQMRKSASQVKRDLELSLIGNAQTLVTGNSTTGVNTPTLGANKPGAASGAPAKWLPVTAGGTAGWIPIWV